LLELKYIEGKLDAIITYTEETLDEARDCNASYKYFFLLVSLSFLPFSPILFKISLR
jgi:hypothetical protein